MARSTAHRHGGRGGSGGSDSVELAVVLWGRMEARRAARLTRARAMPCGSSVSQMPCVHGPGKAVEAGQGASASGEEGGDRRGSGGGGAVGVDLGVEGETRRGFTERLQEVAGSKVLVGLAVTEFGSDADARYAALTVAIAKQMLDIGIKDLDDPRFVLTAGEVVRWQSPFGSRLSSEDKHAAAVQNLVQEALDRPFIVLTETKFIAFIDKGDGVVLKEGNIGGSAVLGLPQARVCVCLSRLYDACAKHISASQHREEPVGSGPQAQGYQQQLDVAELLNKIVASITHRSPETVRDADENQAEREGKRNAQVLAAYDEKVRKH
jgi:hypothetical protein